MGTYKIQDKVYFEMMDRCVGSFIWDCIEFADGCAIIFACKNGRPCDVEVHDADDNVIQSDFSHERYEALMD